MTSSSKYALCLLSGGMDSAVALWWALEKGYEVTIVEFDYKGRPKKEKEFVSLLAAESQAKKPISINFPFLYNETLLNGFIPGRNLLYFSTSATIAESLGISNLIGGQLATDKDEFSDASGHFFSNMEDLINKGKGKSFPRIKIFLPLIKLNKIESLKLAKKLRCPLEFTWSCFYDLESPCGKCKSCIERTKAFEYAESTDPALSFSRRKK